jgi:hypothetical protein
MRNLGLRLWSLRAQPQCNVSVIITRILESYMKSVLCFESEICSCRLSAPVVSVDLGARGSKEWCGPRVFMRQPDPTTGPEHLWTEAGIGCRREGTETGFVVQWCCVQQRSRGGCIMILPGIVNSAGAASLSWKVVRRCGLPSRCQCTAVIWCCYTLSRIGDTAVEKDHQISFSHSFRSSISNAEI